MPHDRSTCSRDSRERTMGHVTIPGSRDSCEHTAGYATVAKILPAHRGHVSEPSYVTLRGHDT